MINFTPPTRSSFLEPAAPVQRDAKGREVLSPEERARREEKRRRKEERDRQVDAQVRANIRTYLEMKLINLIG
jgi:hypothetical protein